MELFSLVLINMLFCGVMYVFISAKVQKAVSEYYDNKLNRAIDMATSETLKELDSTVGIIESRLSALRSMIEKAEMIAKEFKHYEKTEPKASAYTGQRIDEVPPYAELGMSLEKEMAQKEIHTSEKKAEEAPSLIREQRTEIGNIYQSNQYRLNEEGIQTTEGAVNQAFSKIGKVVKGMIGIEDLAPSAEAIGNVQIPQFKPKTDYTVGGDPFSDDFKRSVVIRDENKEGKTRREFLTQLSYANDPAYAQHQRNFEDQIILSLDSVLEELPASATKIDKVVLLLKKGYSHDEISEYMSIGTHEIHLIETIRLDRSRRI
jgi:hypothetical protein